MINVRSYLHGRRKAELQTIHQFWFPGESMLTVRGELETRIQEALSEGTRLEDGVARLSRVQRTLLQSVLRAPDHCAECGDVHEQLELQGTSSVEVENAGRMLLERGFIGRSRNTTPSQECYEIPAELAGHLEEVFDGAGQQTEAADQMSQKRLPFEIDFDGQSLEKRIRKLGIPRLEKLVRVAVANQGLAERNTAGVQELLAGDEVEVAGDLEQSTLDLVETQEPRAASRGGTEKVFPDEWRGVLEKAGIGTVGSVSLKDFGIQVEEPALVVFQEWVSRHCLGALERAPEPDTVLEGGVDLYIDIDRLASRLEAEPAQLTRGDRVPKRLHESLRQMMHIDRLQDAVEGDLVQTVLVLSQRLGIIEKYAGRLEIHGERFRLWRKLDLTRQVHVVLKQFLEEKQGARWSFHQETMRRILIEVLKEHVSEEWVPISGLVGLVVSTYMLELEEREVRQALRQKREENFSRERLSCHFHALGRDLVYWVVNRLLLLGMCELGSQNGRLVGFRLTALGKEVLGIEREPRDSRILVNPNFEIMLFCDGLRGMHLEMTLARFAERTSAEQVRRYRVTRETIREGIRSGLSLTDIQRVLESAADHALPDPVLVALKDWGKDLDWVEIRPTVQLRLLPARATELCEVLEEVGCRHFSNDAGLVSVEAEDYESGAWDEALERLRDAGWLVRSDDDDANDKDADAAADE
ncbi:MAG: helicase-associated domain-containing protein [Planctomycetota bacterium]